jgi:phenylpropionate dioxygenase-like ring-hydroxylating dioxygenase large terminal subunit
MRVDHQRRLCEQLRHATLAVCEGAQPFAIPAERYTSAAWLERERALFAAPRIVAHAGQVATPGTCLTVDDRGAIIVRGADGVVRGFANACRHRATRLVEGPCEKKAFVCPYHGWTYDLRGSLLHVPHADAFAGVELSGRGLVELPVAERHSLVWLGTADAAAFLGGLDDDLGALDLAAHVPWQTARITRQCNWKLVIEAFLDGYHIRVLHRDSIYRFFLDACSVAEPVGPHIRASTGRRALQEAPTSLADMDGEALRLLATPSYLVFPSTIIIEHPDFVSVVTVLPLAPNVCDYQHLMLVPAARAGEREHWDRSWTLIEEGVFQREDLWVAEQSQRGLASGAIDELLFGTLEHPVRDFHAAIERELNDTTVEKRS